VEQPIGLRGYGIEAKTSQAIRRTAKKILRLIRSGLYSNKAPAGRGETRAPLIEAC